MEPPDTSNENDKSANASDRKGYNYARADWSRRLIWKHESIKLSERDNTWPRAVTLCSICTLRSLSALRSLRSLRDLRVLM